MHTPIVVCHTIHFVLCLKFIYLFIMICSVYDHNLTPRMTIVCRSGDSRRTGGWTLLICQVGSLLRGQVLTTSTWTKFRMGLTIFPTNVDCSWYPFGYVISQCIVFMAYFYMVRWLWAMPLHYLASVVVLLKISGTPHSSAPNFCTPSVPNYSSQKWMYLELKYI